MLEEQGLLLLAADAWADAAILAARAAIESDAERRAIGLCERMGAHPLLGPVPERRWRDTAATKEISSGA